MWITKEDVRIGDELAYLGVILTVAKIQQGDTVNSYVIEGTTVEGGDGLGTIYLTSKKPELLLLNRMI